MAYENDILTRNDNDELAVRTVQSVGDNPASSYDDVYTRDNNGKLAVRVVGTGGGDVSSVNGKTGAVVLNAEDVGALENTATGEDSLTIEGSPTAFFGAVNVGKYSQANNVGGVAAGCNAKTYGFAGVAVGSAASSNAAYAVQIGGDNQINFDANTVKFGNANGNFEIMSADGSIPSDRLTHAIRKLSTMPTAGSGYLGQTVLFDGTTDSTYTHGYIYECKAQGTSPETYAWEQVDVMPVGSSVESVNGKTGVVVLNASDVGAIPQVSTMPMAGADELGKVYQFIGTTGTYTHGYFYECSGGNNVPTSGQLTITDYIVEPDVSPTVNVNVDTFNNYAIEHDFETLSSDNLDVSIYFPNGQIDIVYNNSYTMKLYFLVNDKNSAQAILALVGITCDMTNWDIVQESAPFFVGETPTGTHYAWLMTKVQGGQQGVPDVVGGNKYLYTSGGRPYWKTVNEVPDSNGYAGAVLTTTGNGSYWGYVIPSQTGNSGKFLTTDGTDASWSDKPLVNTATGTNALTIFGTPATLDGSINIGNNSVMNGTSTSQNNILIGTNTRLGTGTGRTVSDTVLIGTNSQAPMFGGGVAIGGDTYVYDVGLAAGWKAESRAPYAIQLGRGANSAANTFSVGLSASNNYRMLDSDGTIPAARHAALPAADGTYTLQLVIADGVPTLSWVAV